MLQNEKEGLQKQAAALQAELQAANQQIGSLIASKGQLEGSLQHANQQHQLLLVEHKALQDRVSATSVPKRCQPTALTFSTTYPHGPVAAMLSFKNPDTDQVDVWVVRAG